MNVHSRQMRVFLARAGALIFTILTAVWAILIWVSNWIGRSTVVDDYNQLVERLPAIVAWLLSTPWWVPAMLASILTVFLVWLSWPRSSEPATLRLQWPTLFQRKASPFVKDAHI